MPVPKGVSPKKFDDCVEEVKAKEGKKVNAYAVCNSALKSDIKKQGESRSAADEMAYKECVAQEKRTGSTNPYAICGWRTGRSKPAGGGAPAPAAKSEEKNSMSKKENELDWGHWGPFQENLSLLDMVSRKPDDKVREEMGDKKEEKVFGDFVKDERMFQGPWENSPKMIRKQPKPKVPNRPGQNAPKSAKISAPKVEQSPTHHFKKPLTMKSETATLELQPGMSYGQLKKMQDDSLKKRK